MSWWLFTVLLLVLAYPAWLLELLVATVALTVWDEIRLWPYKRRWAAEARKAKRNEEGGE